MAKRTVVYNDIIFRALKVLNIYSEADEPTPYQTETARDVFSDLLDRLELKGIRVFRREWRTRTFESSSSVVVNSVNYECIQSHQSVNATTWASGTSYSADDVVYPVTYNAMYYVAQDSGGTSGGAEPTWNVNQDSTTTDNDITWKAFPDTKPGVGKNWVNYWAKKGSGGVAWAINTTYRASGTFDLKNDEIEILSASTIIGSLPAKKIKLIDEYTYGQSAFVGKSGQPEELYMSNDGKYNKTVQLFPNPDKTGPSGYVLNYLVNKRASDASEGASSIDYPSHWVEFLIFALASSLCPYFQIELETAANIDFKAQSLYKELKQSDTNTRIPKGVTPCW